MALWRLLRDFFLRQRRAYGTAILCLLGVGLLNLTLPWWIGKAIDACAPASWIRPACSGASP